MIPPAPFSIGDRVVLVNAPSKWEKWRGHHGAVTRAMADPRFEQALWVRFDGFEGGEPLGPICSRFCEREPVTGDKPPRKPVLNLHPPPDDRTERQIQDACINLLRSFGYVVLAVGQYGRRVQCEDCGRWIWPRGYGNAPGVSDLLVYHPLWWGPKGRRRPVLMIEMKSSEKAERRERQEEVAAEGATAFCWSERMALKDVCDFEADWARAGANPDLVAWLEATGALKGEEVS